MYERGRKLLLYFIVVTGYNNSTKSIMINRRRSVEFNLNPNNLDWNKVNGMMPVIVQHYKTGKVLMFAYMTKEALDKTIESGLATFFSRTKNRLWTKGEESKNYLYVKALSTDCDNDTILLSAEPAGPTCHTNTESCFGENADLPYEFLAKLEMLIESRKDAESSYTAKLFSKGVPRIAKKLGEEAVETALTSVTENDTELLEEASDLLYHLTVLLSAKNLSLADVITCLKKGTKALINTKWNTQKRS